MFIYVLLIKSEYTESGIDTITYFDTPEGRARAIEYAGRFKEADRLIEGPRWTRILGD